MRRSARSRSTAVWRIRLTSAGSFAGSLARHRDPGAELECRRVSRPTAGATETWKSGGALIANPSKPPLRRSRTARADRRVVICVIRPHFHELPSTPIVRQPFRAIGGSAYPANWPVAELTQAAHVLGRVQTGKSHDRQDKHTGSAFAQPGCPNACCGPSNRRGPLVLRLPSERRAVGAGRGS